MKLIEVKEVEEYKVKKILKNMRSSKIFDVM